MYIDSMSPICIEPDFYTNFKVRVAYRKQTNSYVRCVENKFSYLSFGVRKSWRASRKQSSIRKIEKMPKTLLKSYPYLAAHLYLEFQMMQPRVTGESLIR